MPLIDKLDETKLRSLKFGHDRHGGGSSNQPYIKVSLEDVDNPINQIKFLKFDDGFVRGGTIGRLTAALTDTIRIGKFLTDPPKGPLFITKQVGLQLSNPKLELKGIPKFKKNTGITGLLNQGIDLLNKNNIGPTRIYNLGINTLAQIPLNAVGGHIERHGLTPFQDPNNIYSKVVKSNDISGNNSLVLLKDKLAISSTPKNKNFGIFTNIVNTTVLNSSEIIDSYIGGPNSFLGIGKTTIRRFDNTSDLDLFNKIADENKFNLSNRLSNINYFNTQELSKRYLKESKFGTDALLDINFLDPALPTKSSHNDFTVGGNYTNNDNIKNDIDQQLLDNVDQLVSSSILQIVNFTNPLIRSQIGNSPVISYKNTQIKYKNGYGDSINISGTWKTFNRETRIGSARQDEINLTPLFSSIEAPGTRIKIPGSARNEYNVRDLIKFRIEAVDGNNPSDAVWIIFRAYLKGITDSFNPELGEIKYIGRGEKFRIHNGFDRQISFNYKVAALSRDEMMPMYQKLNFLASNISSDYTDQGLMRGAIIRLTIGNYIYRQPGFISSLTYTIADDTPWEIAIDEPEGGENARMYELPHIIDVSMTFLPIHNFLPSKDPTNPFIADKGGKGDNPWLDNIVINDAQTLSR